MKTRRLRAAIVLVLLGSPLTGLAADHCDIPGQAAAGFAAADAAACAQRCQQTANCQKWVFVSGWNHCFLKDTKTSPRSLTMYAGLKGHPPTADRDHSGKDLQKVPGVKTAEACATACESESRCGAYAYIDAYRDCYLKDAKGRLSPKVFHCGTRDP